MRAQAARAGIPRCGRGFREITIRMVFIMLKSFIKDIFMPARPERQRLTAADRISTLKFYLLAFTAPFAVVIVFSWFCELAPFGNYTLMAIDAWGQYFPMLREMKRAFRGLDFGYSFTGALGFDLTAQSAYYTNSPLWYILFLLPGELTTAQVDMMVFIRFGIAGLTFSYYLSSHFGKKSKAMILFGMAYALSGYTLAFINQFMWMDAVLLLPLVLAGVERLYKGEGGLLLYTVSLFLTIYSNFYIAYAVCIFAVLWFFLQTVCDFRGVRSWFVSAFRFGICSLAAGALNLGVLIPLLGAIGNTLASDMGFNRELDFYHSWGDILMMLVPFKKSSLAYEAPNIYFGLVPAILMIPALLSRISVKKKLAYTALILFMLVSFNFNLLDFIWHGFHFPNQLPGRQSFLFIFLCLTVSWAGFDFLVNRKISGSAVKRIVSALLLVLICTEISANALLKFGSDIKKVSEGSILRNDDVMSVIREDYSCDEDENEFWRTELNAHRYNGGQLYGYNGISHYSSTMSGACYKFFTQLGMSVYAKNVSIEYTPNPVLNSLFGIRYIVSESAVTDEVSVNAGNALTMYVHENTAVLPLFYVGEKDVLGVDMSLTGHALTNDIFKRIAGCSDVISGNGVFADRRAEGYILDTDEFLKGIDSILESKCEITDFSSRKIEGTVNAVKDGVLVISLPAADVEIEIDGKKVDTLTIAGYMAGAEISEGAHTITIKL